jgi:hypothetical protein
MEAWHSIQIGSLWLTQDNTSSGNPMINNISNLGAIKNGRLSQVITALDGEVWKQRVPLKGMPFSINFPAIDETNFNALEAIVNAADAADSSLSVVISGLTGTYYLTVKTGENPFDFDGSYINTTIFNLTLNFIVANQTYTVSATAGTLTLTGSSVTLTQG